MSLQFVVRNMSSVVRSRDWRERLIDHPALMAEVYIMLENSTYIRLKLFRLWKQWQEKNLVRRLQGKLPAKIRDRRGKSRRLRGQRAPVLHLLDFQIDYFVNSKQSLAFLDVVANSNILN